MINVLKWNDIQYVTKIKFWIPSLFDFVSLIIMKIQPMEMNLLSIYHPIRFTSLYNNPSSQPNETSMQSSFEAIESNARCQHNGILLVGERSIKYSIKEPNISANDKFSNQSSLYSNEFFRFHAIMKHKPTNQQILFVFVLSNFKNIKCFN